MSKLSRRSLVAGAATVPALALPLAVPSIADVTGHSVGEVSFPDLVARFIRVRERWADRMERDKAYSKIISEAFFRAAGMTSEEWKSLTWQDPRWKAALGAWQQVNEENPDGNPVDEDGVDIEWDAIDGELWPLMEAMLDRAPRSLADLAWQADVLLTADADLRESQDGSRVRKLIENIFALSGPVTTIPTGATGTAVQQVNAVPSAMEKAVARLSAARAVVAKIDASPDDDGEAALNAAVDEQNEAVWAVIRAPAGGLADVRRRARVVRQLLTDLLIEAEDSGCGYYDKRHHAALAALIADIFNDKLMAA